MPVSVRSGRLRLGPSTSGFFIGGKVEIEYMDGERVYVEGRYRISHLYQDWEYRSGLIQIMKHRDVLKAINKLLKRALEDSSGEAENNFFRLVFLINQQLERPYTIPCLIVKEESVKFDRDQKNIKRHHYPRLYEADVRNSKVQNSKAQISPVTAKPTKPHKFKPRLVHNNVESNDTEDYDILSDEFKAWMAAQGMKDSR